MVLLDLCLVNQIVLDFLNLTSIFSFISDKVDIDMVLSIPKC